MSVCLLLDYKFFVIVLLCLLWLRLNPYLRFPLITSAIPLLIVGRDWHLFSFLLLLPRHLSRPSQLQATWLFALELATQLQLLIIDVRSGFSLLSHLKIVFRASVVVLVGFGKSPCHVTFALVLFSHVQNVLWAVLEQTSIGRTWKLRIMRVFSVLVFLGLLVRAPFSTTGALVMIELFQLYKNH
jgi:hypothetical protein